MEPLGALQRLRYHAQSRSVLLLCNPREHPNVEMPRQRFDKAAEFLAYPVQSSPPPLCKIW
eukprot:1500827-Pyramimonas_sp.AAC.2